MKCAKNDPQTSRDCINQASDKDKQLEKVYCCYIKYKILEEEFTSCKAFSLDEMNIIFDYTHSKKDESDGLRILKLDCANSYLALGLFYLIFLLL